MHELIRVKILSREYPLRVEAKDVESTRQLAAKLNSRMRKFKRDHAGQPDLIAAVMVAMALEEKLHHSRSHAAKASHTLSGALDELSSALAAALR